MLSSPGISRRNLMLGAALATCLSSTGAIAATGAYVHLTFDDGPDPALTPMLLDLLGLYQQKATFFVVGQRVPSSSRILRRMVNEGHSVGNHSWSHPDLGKSSMSRVLKQVGDTNRAIEDAVGFSPRIFRPPYGSFTSAQVRALRQETGMRTVMWDTDTLDWQRPGTQAILSRVQRGLRPGCVVLMHDIHRGTVQAAPEVLSLIANSGYRSAAVA